MSDTHDRRDGHLTVYALWPVVAGLLMGLVLAVSVGGLALLATRGDWQTAGAWAGATFCVVLGVVSVATFTYAAREWAGPRARERLATAGREIDTEPAPEPAPRFIPITTKRPLRYEPPELPDQDGDRRGVAAAIGLLADRLTRSTPVHSYEQQADSIEPEAAPWVREMYGVLCASWPDRLTRRDFRELFPEGGVSLWRRYINGTGDRRSQRGVLQVWGCIEKADNRGSWRYTQPLDVIFSLDPDLRRYAETKSRLVQRSPKRRDDPKSGASSGPVPSRPNSRTGGR